MELLHQAVAQLENLILRARMSEDQSVLMGLMGAQNLIRETIVTTLTRNSSDPGKADGNDEVWFHRELDPRSSNGA
jgi:hypothetical protein